MRILFILIVTSVIVSSIVCPVHAMDFTAPAAPADVQKFIPEENATFSDGLWYVIKNGIAAIQPDITEAAGTCLSLIAIIVLLSIFTQFSKTTAQIINIITALCLGLILFRSNYTFIQIGTETIQRMSDYGRLLLPTLTAAAAANGMTATSAALYAGTMLFSTILTTLISKCIIPLVYVYIAVSIANCAFSNDSLKGMKQFVKWLSTWSIKTVLYIFTGYMGITGVISGSVDASAIKAAKLTISSAVPIVGTIISDASETILVSAGIMKNSVGMYGLFATIAICLGPFLRIGIHYILLRLTTAICGAFSNKSATGLLQDMTGAMGLVLAMTGAVCLLLLICIVCMIRCHT